MLSSDIVIVTNRWSKLSLRWWGGISGSDFVACETWLESFEGCLSVMAKSSRFGRKSTANESDQVVARRGGLAMIDAQLFCLPALRIAKTRSAIG